MEFMKHSLSQVKDFFGHLGPTERWLIGALLIILVFVGVIVVDYAGETDRVAINGFTGESKGAVVNSLNEHGIDAKLDNGQIKVPREKWADALVVLEESDLLKADLSSAFDEMIIRQSMWVGEGQKQREFLIAKQKVLGLVIGRMKNVDSALVMLDRPKNDRFGRHVRPSASVSVTMDGQHQVDRGLVESIAGMVSGGVVDMKAQDVTVVDANAGRKFTVEDPIDQMPEKAWLIVRRLEHDYRNKIGEMLNYIPNVNVTVSVTTDPVIHKKVTTNEHGPEPLESTTEEETTSNSSAPTGPAGVRPNTEMDIGEPSQSTNTQKTTKSETKYRDIPVKKHTEHIEAGHTLKQVNVTVGVPRTFVVSLYRAANPDVKEDPQEADITKLADAEIAKIQSQVEPHVITADAQGVVRVIMVHDGVAAGAMTAGVAESTGVVAMLDQGWVQPAGLMALALCALAMMFGMVRKATSSHDMPTAEELAGVPPTLPGDDDLIGEADASDASMTGLEVGESELHTRRVADQIAEMINSSPADAASLFGKWVNTED